MEDAVNSQRSIVFFLWKEGAPTSEIARRLKGVFEDEAMRERTVYKWVNRFESGRVSLEDDPRSGRPATCVTEETVSLIADFVSKNRCATVREIAVSTGISSTRQLETSFADEKVNGALGSSSAQ